MADLICTGCGQLLGVEAYDDKLWDLYSRLDDGRQHVPALVFDGEWLNENVVDDEDREVLMFTMEKDMHGRGLCPECGRPDLAGIPPERFLDEDAARAQAEMAAERRAEQRIGGVR